MKKIYFFDLSIDTIELLVAKDSGSWWGAVFVRHDRPGWMNKSFKPKFEFCYVEIEEGCQSG